DGDRCGSSFAIPQHVYVLVVNSGSIGRPLQGGQGDSLCAQGAIAWLGQLQGALFHVLGELLGLDDFIDEAPVLGALAADAIGIGAEDVGMVAADSSFVRHAREATRPGENTE